MAYSRGMGRTVPDERNCSPSRSTCGNLTPAPARTILRFRRQAELMRQMEYGGYYEDEQVQALELDYL